MNDVKTLLDAIHSFVYPLTSKRLSMVVWRELTSRRIRKGRKYAKIAMDIFYLLYK